MSSETATFGKVASSLARNPLGIIALFIVLVYGLAATVATSAGSLTPQERMPLIYFLVSFPIIVLFVFSWLVSKHSGKLFAPSDFKDEENYIKMQMTAVASLSAAASRRDTSASPTQLEELIEIVRAARPATATATGHTGSKDHVLWVDDRPENNTYERQAFEAIGLRFTLALSTNEALERLAGHKFAAVISDMGRREGPREGYVLLDELRRKGDQTPLFFYASSNAPEHKRETAEHGGQGCTNNAQELFQMVTRTVIQGRPS